jgi:hypothetical protein
MESCDDGKLCPLRKKAPYIGLKHVVRLQMLRCSMASVSDLVTTIRYDSLSHWLRRAASLTGNSNAATVTLLYLYRNDGGAPSSLIDWSVNCRSL